MWEVNFDYFTTYRAGEGPYYDKDASNTPIYPALTAEEHYEEYGFEGQLYADVIFTTGIGSTHTGANEGWLGSMGLNVDVFTIKPYRQTVWWTRFIGNLIDTGSFTAHAWVGGAYDLQFG